MALLTKKTAIPRVRVVEKHTYFRTALNILGAVFAIVGGFFVFTEHFASAADLKGLQTVVVSGQQQTKTELEINRLAGEINVLKMRKSSLDDRVYDLGKRKDQEGVARYSRELAEVNAEMNAKVALLDRLRTGK
jgi:hypothetical protein